MSRYWQPTYTRQDGTVVRGHWVNDSRTRRDTEVPAASRPTPYEPSTYPPPTSAYAPPPSPVSHAASRPRNKKRKAAIAITAAAVVTAGVVTLTLTGGSSAGASGSISVQTTVNFNQVMTELPKLGFAGVVTQNATSDSSQNCSQASTGEVQKFFVNNPCKELAVTCAIRGIPQGSPQISMDYATHQALTAIRHGRRRCSRPGTSLSTSKSCRQSSR